MSLSLMYTLDFETIKQVMQEHQKTGLLYADAPSGAASLREPCRIEINITAGAIASCSIVGNSGQRVTGKEAMQALPRLGRLRWTFVPQQQVVVQPASPVIAGPVETPFFPWRTAQVEQWQTRNWPRLHRTVFALVDGTKSVAKIAEILSTSPELVEKALHDLQSIGVITMGPQNGRNRTRPLNW
jgi:hypothetical protein